MTPIEQIVTNLPDIIYSLKDRTLNEIIVRDINLALADTLTCSALAKADTKYKSPVYLQNNNDEYQSKTKPWKWKSHEKDLKADEAVFLNSYSSQFLDFDSVHYATFGHPAAIIFPAIIAYIEMRPSAYRRFHHAFNIGIETMAILGALFGQNLRENGYHPTAVTGGLSVAAAINFLTNGDACSLVRAWNFTSATTIGYRRNFGTPLKPLQSAMAARAGFNAALVARENSDWPSDNSWLENLCLLSGGYRKNAKIGETNLSTLEEFPIVFKKYPCCAYFEPIFEAIQSIPEWDSLSPLGIRKIELDVPDFILKHSSDIFPGTADAAKFSIAYCVSNLISGKTIKLEDFRQSQLSNPRIRDLFSIISTHSINSSGKDPKDVPATVTLSTDDRQFISTGLAIKPSSKKNKDIVCEKMTFTNEKYLSHLDKSLLASIISNFEILSFDDLLQFGQT